MATTRTGRKPKVDSEGRVSGVTDSSPQAEAKALSQAEADRLHDKAYGDRETSDVPVPDDIALVQTPDGRATAALANQRAGEKPAPEHVEAAAKTDTVPPYPHQVEALKAANEAAIAAGQNVEPVGPGNSTGMTDRAAPAGDLPPHEDGTFLHPQTKEQLEAQHRYAEPPPPISESVWVTNRQGEQHEVKGGARGRVETDGSLSVLEGPLIPGVDPTVKRTFRSGQWSHWGPTKS